ncbi:MAG TPA: molecular chaperone DnaJ [Alphaproteobacteria bacterium]|jgi:molecular chaperone DnaJ|nr:molecular chaperone DnaJ [Alphaproteobacteria bacterium]
MKADCYETLGVAKGANADDIKRAYRKLAMQFHPDRNPGDAGAEQKFKDVSHAYDILKDDQKRAAYDRFGHAAFENGGPGARGQDGFAANFSDIFDQMFGDMAGRRETQNQRGSDLRYNLEITLEAAFHGDQVTIRVPSWASCEPCHGSGAANGTSPVTCPTCRGAGRVRAQQGFFTIERTCASCGGAGQVIKDPCRSCQGSGRVRKEKTLEVSIPPGVDDGTRIRLSGEGEMGMRGAPPGDLYVFLSVKPHRLFQREEADLHCRVPITMPTAALGGTVEVPTLEGGRSQVTIPPGTQSGQQFRLRGKGMTILRSTGRGDLYIEVSVETPVKLTKRQKELLQEFEREDGGVPGTHPESEGFFAKVKEFLGG